MQTHIFLKVKQKSVFADTRNIGFDAIRKKFIKTFLKYSLQGTTQGRYLTGGVPPVRFSM